jgi:antitoxin ParD1/3/4
VNVSLTPELEVIIQTKVATGHYTSASEVVREALRMMVERDAFEALCHEDIRAKIAKGVASLREGRSHDGDAVFDAISLEMDTLDALQTG